MPHLDAIGIVVSTLADAIDFYRHLGLEFGEASENEPHIEATGPGGIRIMLDTEESVKDFWEPPQGGGQRTSLAFLCEAPAEVDRLYLELVGRGGQGVAAPFDAIWGQRYATIADPDGNRLDLFAWQEGSSPE